ncbi:MAG: ATP-binding protein [Chloroherpetonaceae bacterium]|nr:ATP-binding protein [Chloroherpetonaceae bacterium]MDW8436607.1 ATP-binding protein [Chloroherpetonaceae bacterium]
MNHQNPAATLTEKPPTTLQRYGELIIYAIIFFALVASVFALNIYLARQSEKEANDVFCATRLQQAWRKAQKNLAEVQNNLMTGSATKDNFLAFRAGIQTFDSIVTAFYFGGVVTLDGMDFALTKPEDPRSKRIINDLQEMWSPIKTEMLNLARSNPDDPSSINQDLLFRMVEYAITRDDAILDASQAFIVKLGELSQERIARLQFFQVAALIGIVVVFLAMAIRVTISLRKKDALLRRRTEQIIEQRDAIAKEKEKVDALLKDLQATQAQLVQSEKMASLGQMVAGLAHEVNTPLGFVRGNIEISQRNHRIISNALREHDKLRRNLESGEVDELERILLEAKESMEKINDYQLIEKTDKVFEESLQGIDRLQELVANLKNFSRLDEAVFKVADLNEGLDSALMIANNVIKHKATVKKNYAPNCLVECYPAQLNQVFLNLLTNAAQAIEDGKRGEICLSTAINGEWATVKISDNGKGIPKEHLNKIFEPFFTTKPVGQGTGLGLSIAYKIIERHNGAIDVESEVGKGSTFTIKLPVKQKKKAN